MRAVSRRFSTLHVAECIGTCDGVLAEGIYTHQMYGFPQVAPLRKDFGLCARRRIFTFKSGRYEPWEIAQASQLPDGLSIYAQLTKLTLVDVIYGPEVLRLRLPLSQKSCSCWSSGVDKEHRLSHHLKSCSKCCPASPHDAGATFSGDSGAWVRRRWFHLTLQKYRHRSPFKTCTTTDSSHRYSTWSVFLQLKSSAELPPRFQAREAGLLFLHRLY